MLQHINRSTLLFSAPVTLEDLTRAYKCGVSLDALCGVALRHLEPEPTGHAQWRGHRALNPHRRGRRSR